MRVIVRPVILPTPRGRHHIADVFSTYRDGTQIGESAMIVIDSETGKYEKIEVLGKPVV